MISTFWSVAWATTLTLGKRRRKSGTISRIANCMVATAAVQRTVPVGSFSRWRMAVSASSASRNIAAAHAVPRRRGHQDWELQRLRDFGKSEDVMLKLCDRIVTHSGHEADLV